MYPGKGNAADLSLAQTSWEESIRAYSLSAHSKCFRSLDKSYRGGMRPQRRMGNLAFRENSVESV